MNARRYRRYVPILNVGLRQSWTTTCKQEEFRHLSKNGKLLNRPYQVCDKFIRLEYMEKPDAMMWKCLLNSIETLQLHLGYIHPHKLSRPSICPRDFSWNEILIALRQAGQSSQGMVFHEAHPQDPTVMSISAFGGSSTHDTSI